MANSDTAGLPAGPVGALKRPSYQSGNYLATADLLSEQRYRIQRLRRLNRYRHGWGVVCGCLVVPAKDPGRPWALWVCPGYAIGPYGDEIDVPAPILLDVRDYLWTRPRVGGRRARLAYVGIRYDEEPARPTPASSPACGCQDPTYVPSRIRDGFRVDILWTRPETRREPFDLCIPQVVPCPDCPDSPYVVLARVILPAGESDPITVDQIDNWSPRRTLSSTSSLEAQLIPCCCNKVPRFQP